MKISVQIKIVNNDKKTVLNNYSRPFDVNNITTLDFKNEIKSFIFGIDETKIVKEILFLGNAELEDDQLVPEKSGLKYNLFLN